MIAGLLLLVACEDPSGEETGETGSAPASVFDQVQYDVFLTSCAGAGCHDSTTRAGDLDLTEDTAYEALREKPCFNEEAAAAGLLRVTPGDPDASLLYLKLVEPVRYGEVMPPWGPPDEDTVALVRRWIAEGADP